jgi:hypothetical protein
MPLLWLRRMCWRAASPSCKRLLVCIAPNHGWSGLVVHREQDSNERLRRSLLAEGAFQAQNARTHRGTTP